MMRDLMLIALGALSAGAHAKSHKDTPCLWTTGKHTYDLRAMTRTPKQLGYTIIDGDVPCTPETEPSYAYSWNFCANVNPTPDVCERMGKSGVALQYIYISEQLYDCYVIGRYNPEKDDLSYSLLDPKDPSKGIQMLYPSGEKCSLSGIMRSATLDVQCADTPGQIVSALATESCSYHLVMKSYHGCPQSCKITKNGLCNAHGHCAYDSNAKESYCFCDYGFGGDSCEPLTKTEGYDGYSVQVGLMSTLVVVVIAMISGLSYMTYQVMSYRKAQTVGVYNFLTSVEMAQKYDESF